MAKYRVTEAQLQKIFEDIETKRLSEMDNYSYPETHHGIKKIHTKRVSLFQVITLLLVLMVVNIC